jgi:2-iminobutanoate/2-iminopropanoate deaminase
MQKKPVFSKSGPVQGAPYTPAIRIGNVLYVSGQVPIDPHTSKLIVGGFEEQAHQCLRNLSSLLEQGGSDLDHVVKTTVFLSDLENFSHMNGIYSTYFNGVLPARSCVQVARLPLDSMIEIEAIALIAADGLPNPSE